MVEQASFSIKASGTATPVATKIPTGAITMLITNRGNDNAYWGLSRAQNNFNYSWVRSSDANSLAAGATALVNIVSSIFVPQSSVGPVQYQNQAYLSIQGEKIASDDQNYGAVNVDVYFT
jgi:hypothetical protein